MNIGDHVVVKDEALLSHGRSGTIEDFENPKLRDNSSLILVQLKPNIYKWFFGRELKIIEK